MASSRPRCLVAMSGGVDSSVAAALLAREGYDCTGVTMKLFDAAPFEGPEGPEAAQRTSACCGLDDVEDAKRVCASLGIAHYTLNHEREFTTRVIEPFVAAYYKGATPNPCLECNRHLKFGQLYRWARETGFDCLATGHYARIMGNELHEAADNTKDQSYTLYMLTPEVLAYLRLPLGAYTKAQVRSLAQELELPTAHKHESQDICFVPNGRYAEFLEGSAVAGGAAAHAAACGAASRGGEIVTTNGTVLGHHEGIHRFTIGQRRGIGVAAREPLYVLELDPETARVVVGGAQELGKQCARVVELTLLNPHEALNGKTVSAMHRYRGSKHLARVTRVDANTIEVDFVHSQRDLTPGQALVLYEGHRVMGGGIIQSTATKQERVKRTAPLALICNAQQGDGSLNTLPRNNEHNR